MKSTSLVLLAAFAGLAAAPVCANPVREAGHDVAKAGRATGHVVADAGRETGHVVAKTGRHIGHAVHRTFRHHRRHHPEA